MRHRHCTGHRGHSLEAWEIGEWAPQRRWSRSVANQHVSAFESSWEALSTFTKLFTGSESSLTFFNTVSVISLSQAAHIRFKQVICTYIRIGKLSPTWGFYEQHWPCSRTQNLEDTPRGRASPGSDCGENDQRELSPCSKTHYDTGRTKSTDWLLIRDLGMTLNHWLDGLLTETEMLGAQRREFDCAEIRLGGCSRVLVISSRGSMSRRPLEGWCRRYGSWKMS